jgi:hypothetical protein
MEDLIQQLEDHALILLLAGDDPVLHTLRTQLQHSTRTSRELTGVGFYTNFLVASDAPRLSGNPSFHIGDLFAEMEGLQFGTGFVLFVTEGSLTLLEACTYSEDWPNKVLSYKLIYLKNGITDGKRDLEALRLTQGWPSNAQSQ